MSAEIFHRLSVKELVELIRGEERCLNQIISTSRVHAIDGKGDTALHICAAQGRLLFCDRLINAGSDPALETIKVKERITALVRMAMRR